MIFLFFFLFFGVSLSFSFLSFFLVWSLFFPFFFLFLLGQGFYKGVRGSWFDFSFSEDLLLSDEWFIDYDLYSEVDYWWNWFDPQDDEVTIDDWGWTQENYQEDLFIEIEVSDLSSELDVAFAFWLYEL